MATRKFRNNFKFLSKLFETPEKFAEYLIQQKSLSEDFIQRVTGTDTNNANINDFNYLKNDFDYEVDYDQDTKKIRVNVATNNVFSYWDSEEELIERMNMYIKNEDYESAKILNDYFHTIDLNF